MTYERGIDLAHTTITVGAAIRPRVYKAAAAVRAPQRTFRALRRNVDQDDRELGFSVRRSLIVTNTDQSLGWRLGRSISRLVSAVSGRSRCLPEPLMVSSNPLVLQCHVNTHEVRTLCFFRSPSIFVFKITTKCAACLLAA
jgi:hypothetical protein